MRHFRFLLILLLLPSVSFSITRYAVTNGNWENGSSWTSGTGPACGDSIVIPAGTTITITSNLDYTACLSSMKVSVLGTLFFQTGKKLRLPCGSGVYVFNGGLIDPGGGGGSSNLIDICSVTVWIAGQGPISGPDCLPAGSDCNNFALPVELLSFSADMTDAAIKLTWHTASEKDNDRFEVQKSVNGSDFSTFTIVKGAGSSSKLQSYEATDPVMPIVITYYRLKQVDFNGGFSYSKIIAVKPAAKNLLSLYPNPADERVSVNASQRNKLIYIYDFSGNLFRTVTPDEDGYLKTADFPEGMYFISAEPGYKFGIEKLVIEHD